MKTKLLLLALLTAGCGLQSYAQWVSVSSSATTGKYESIYFWDANNCIASSSSNLIKTSNGGTTWTGISGAPGIRDIDFTSATVGYAAGSVSTSLKKTTNAGTTWTALTPINSSSLWGVSVVDANTAYVSGVSGIVWKTTNGGSTWTAVNLGVSTLLVDLQFFNATTGCILDQSSRVYRTTNGGTTWTNTYTGTGSLFTSMYFVNTSVGFAVGSSGKIIKSTDGGLSWTPLTSGSTAYLQYVHFYDVNNGIVAGLGGVVLRTTNGGTTWFQETTGTTQDLYSCILLSPTSAIAAGNAGTVIKNTNLTSGIEDPGMLDVSVNTYPNTFSDHFTCTISGTGSDADLSMDVYDINGKLMLSTELAKDENTIETAGWSEGTYMYAIKQKGVLVKSGKIVR